MTAPTGPSAIDPAMNEQSRPFEQTGRLRLRSALIGGSLAAIGSLLAWVVIGNFIR